MSKWGDCERIVQWCERQRAQLWDGFERVRPGLVEVARYLYPGALPGLLRDARELASLSPEEDEDDSLRLTGAPFDAFRIAYSGFFVNLTNPNRPWFRLGCPKFGKTDPSQDDWYQECYDRLTDATDWLMKWAGVYRPLRTLYKHLVAFGFGCIATDEDDERYVFARCLRVGTYALGVDRKGRVDRVVERFAYTGGQMVEEFGAENVSEAAVRAARDGDRATRFEVWRLVEPHTRPPRGQSPFTLSFERFRYRSVHWTADAGEAGRGLLAVRGYRIKPIVAPRLEFEFGDVYGRGCGRNVVGRCRGLQTLRESSLEIADQMAHPAMMAPASMADDGLRLGAYDVNYYPDGLPPNSVHRAVSTPPSAERVDMAAAAIEQEIRKDLFNSEFETINAMQDGAARSGDRMTATEVQVRVNEKMEQLSGIATTLNDELLDPLVTMMSGYVRLSCAGGTRLPPILDLPPEILRGDAPYDIKYESAIHAAAAAQSINAAATALKYAFDVGQMTNSPDVMDNFDPDEAARDVARKLGTPERYMRDVEERDALRARRAEEAARERQAQEEAVRAKAAKDFLSAPVSPETIGGALAGEGEGGVA